MDFIIEILAEILLETSCDIAGNPKQKRWKRMFAFLILALFLLFYGFILYGTASLSIITFQNKEYGVSFCMFFVSVIILITFVVGIRKFRTIQRKHK